MQITLTAIVADVQRIAGIGIKKIALGAAAGRRPVVATETSAAQGAFRTVVSVVAQRHAGEGHETFTFRGKQRHRMGPLEAAARAQNFDAGEILLSSIDREGTLAGNALPLIEHVAKAVTVSVIALGGAGTFSDLVAALDAGASAVAAGSMFVDNSRHRAVFITYSTASELRSLARRPSKLV